MVQVGSGADDLALASLAHELRTPITAIVGYSELIASRRAACEDLERYSDHLLAAAQTLEQTVDAMLDMARIARGKLKLSEGSVDIFGELTLAVTLMHDAAAARHMRIVTTTDARLPAVRGDARLLRQVFTNLISNAIKYGAEGSRILVDVALDTEGDLVIEVRDTGVGIAPDDLARVFEPFDRLGRDENNDIRGCGLGLPLARALVELHGGELTLESKVGIGSTATVRLPAERLTRCTDDPQRAFRFTIGGNYSVSSA